jgi:hypothetical protein
MENMVTVSCFVGFRPLCRHLKYPHLNSTVLSHCIAGEVPQSYILDPQLGRWVGTQRSVFKNDRMDVVREAKLDELGFKFSIGTR